MDNERTQYIQIKEAHPEWSLQDTTKRVKRVVFDKSSTIQGALNETLDLWDAANSIYDSPLVQLRTILDSREEQGLVEAVDYINSKDTNLLSKGNGIRIAGRILFRNDNEKYGIYYLQVESNRRQVYVDRKHVEHIVAVNRGLQKRIQQVCAQPLPSGYSIFALDFSKTPKDILTGRGLNIDPEKLAEEIASLHKLAFKFPHDPAQQTKEGVMEILMNNPTLVCFDETGKVVSVGFMERDSRFTFADLVLVEPTYFTNPVENKKGLSSHVRQATKELVIRHNLIGAYQGKPMIVFNESIRHSSFVLSLENGCNLAGRDDLLIDGNLGEAYTAIGPANPEAGFMPMGLTYFISPSIECNQK